MRQHWHLVIQHHLSDLHPWSMIKQSRVIDVIAKGECHHRMWCGIKRSVTHSMRNTSAKVTYSQHVKRVIERHSGTRGKLNVHHVFPVARPQFSSCGECFYNASQRSLDMNDCDERGQHFTTIGLWLPPRGVSWCCQNLSYLLKTHWTGAFTHLTTPTRWQLPTKQVQLWEESHTYKRLICKACRVCNCGAINSAPSISCCGTRRPGFDSRRWTFFSLPCDHVNFFTATTAIEMHHSSLGGPGHKTLLC